MSIHRQVELSAPIMAAPDPPLPYPGFQAKTLKFPSVYNGHDSPWLKLGVFCLRLKPQDGGNRRKGEAKLSCTLLSCTPTDPGWR